MKFQGPRNRGSHPLRAATRESGLYMSCAYPYLLFAMGNRLSSHSSKEKTYSPKSEARRAASLRRRTAWEKYFNPSA